MKFRVELDYDVTDNPWDTSADILITLEDAGFRNVVVIIED